LQPQFQDGWNRKGLLSEKGDKKKAWYVMKDYFSDVQLNAGKR
jgi:beta-glucuronidase